MFDFRRFAFALVVALLLPSFATAQTVTWVF